MRYFGATINTMTLGGLAIAIGELVDDAIVDVENVFRRLKQNAQSPLTWPVLTVIYKASGEIMTSPGLISCFSPPSCCTQPVPDVTIRICPSGWICHAERAPGSNVTLAPEVRDGELAGKRASTLTLPVKFASGSLLDARAPLRVMVIFCG